MHSLTVILLAFAPFSLASKVLYQRSFNGLSPLLERQTRTCIQENPTCVSCFGAGSIQCVTDSTCYDPTQGQTCCANGYYCEAGYYCVDGGSGCCPNGDSLESCDATASGSTIAPPPATTSSPAAPSSTSTAALVSASASSVSPPPPSCSALFPNVTSNSSVTTSTVVGLIVRSSTSVSKMFSSDSASAKPPLRPTSTNSSSTQSAAATTPVVVPPPATYTPTGNATVATSSVPAQQTTNAGNTKAADIALALGVWVFGFLL